MVAGHHVEARAPTSPPLPAPSRRTVRSELENLSLTRRPCRVHRCADLERPARWLQQCATQDTDLPYMLLRSAPDEDRDSVRGLTLTEHGFQPPVLPAQKPHKWTPLRACRSCCQSQVLPERPWLRETWHRESLPHPQAEES